MPFTLAHPAAIISLRKYLPLSRLVLGSMSPDFEYMLRLTAISEFSHTLSGLLYFCVPIGILFLWLFHYSAKPLLLLLLPFSLRQRLKPYSDFNFWPAGRFALILLAVLIGAFTHIAWDSLTHEYGWTVQRWSILQ